MNYEKELLPKLGDKDYELKLFKQLSINTIFNIPSNMPKIEKIINTNIEIEIMNTNIIPTIKSVSVDNSTRTGRVALIHGKIITSIEYITFSSDSSLFITENISFFSTYIILEDIIRSLYGNNFRITIENKYICILKEDKIFQNILVLITSFPEAIINQYKDEISIDKHINGAQDLINQLSKYYNSNFFTESYLYEIIEISSMQPDIKEVTSMIIEPEVTDYCIVKTIQGLSYEGQYLSGKMLMVRLDIKQKILYMSDNKNPSIYGVENKDMKVAYIVIPEFISINTINFLIKNGIMKFKVKDINSLAMKVSKREISINSFLYIELAYC